MHGRIYQLSTKPISKEDWAKKSTFEEGVDDWCDYIGNESTGDERKSDILNLHSHIYEIFDCCADGTLILNGDIDEFREDWALAIRQTAAGITGKNIFGLETAWRLSKLIKRTHLYLYDMFYIEGEGALTFAELMEYVATHLHKGDRLYIGAIYDFHY